MRAIYAIYAIFVILALVLYGCGPQEIRPQEPPGTAQTGAAEVETADEKTLPEGGRLAEIFARQPEYKVTYEMSSGGIKNEMTQYLSKGRMRTDIAQSGTEMRTYLLDEEFISCSNAGGSWMCQKLEYAKTESDALNEDIKANPDAYDIESAGTRTIAGASADCFRVKTKSGSAEYCYSRDYVPLYIKTTSGGLSSELLAKSYSTSVSESDFAPPAQPSAAPPDMEELLKKYS